MLPRGYGEDKLGLVVGEPGTGSQWMVRRSVQVSADVKLLNSGELQEVSAGNLRAVPWSHSHPFVTIWSTTQPSYPLAPVRAVRTQLRWKGRGTSGMWGQTPYPGESQITGLKPPVCLWHAAQIR